MSSLLPVQRLPLCSIEPGVGRGSFLSCSDSCVLPDEVFSFVPHLCLMSGLLAGAESSRARIVYLAR